ncbi:MAG: serine/threonine-protein kinase [Polyangiaceae bacterium]|jgi:serine/threonine-protein kinase
MDLTDRCRARVGSVIRSKYRLDVFLGAGGMAAVYAATHRNGDRVAIKLLHSEFSKNDTVCGRFLREGYAANRVGHPGAVRVIDDDVDDVGIPYLVMELLQGETLDARWERAPERRLDAREVLDHAERLLDVLSAAHDRGVIHRDIKPDNLFVTTTGDLKVMDFGIARLLEGASGTKTGDVLGTPAFMAPEQAAGRIRDVDGRADVWSVGALMFALLSGRHVHEAKTPHEQLIYAATQPAPSLRTAAPDVHAGVAEVVDVALRFDREVRWPSARLMQQGLRVVAQTMSRASSPPTTTLIIGSGEQAGRGRA